MSIGIIEINGSGITVHSDSGILLESPAFATTDGAAVLLGDDARAQARLKPTETCTRFWDQLSVEPLRKPFLNARHHADIAYWHLRLIWERVKSDRDEVVLAVSGTFDEAQLGILLGIAKSLEIPVAGMIDAALAACDDKASDSPIQLHLDIQLHRIVLTHLALNSELKRVGIRQLVGTGMMQLQQLWMDVIRDGFVRITRFDPMHRAQTEQQLYTGLQDWPLFLLHEKTLSLELSVQERAYGITLNREELVHSAAKTYAQISRLIDDQKGIVDSMEIHLSHRLWSLPGLSESLIAAGTDTVSKLDPHAVARGTIKHRSLMRVSQDRLCLITELPRPRVGRSMVKDNAGRDKPTHILYRSRAYPIGERPLTLGADDPLTTTSLQLQGPLNGISRRHCSIYTRDDQVWVEDHSTYGTFLNEQKIDGRTSLHVGDRIRIGTPGEVLLLIAEIKPNAT